MTFRGEVEQLQPESDRPAHRPPREQTPQPVAAGVLAMQRQAGNAAVSALLGSRPVVQTYVDLGGGARRSDGGKVVKRSDHELYADNALIDDANTKLQRPDASHVGLAKQGAPVNINGKALTRVTPAFHHHAGDTDNDDLARANTPGNLMSLWADCGRSSRVVMGSPNDAAPRASYTAGSTRATTAASSDPSTYSDTIYLRVMPQFLQAKLNFKYLKPGVHYQGSPRQPIVPATADQARAQYQALPAGARGTFDKYAHINTAANPAIGGGYTMNTEYNMPGSAEVPGRRRWNFHWAGVVLKDAADNITLENYANGGYDAVNQDWNFEMYGTAKKGQSFQEEHLGSGTHGTRASTFEVERVP